jgi:hypothetical protein
MTSPTPGPDPALTPTAPSSGGPSTTPGGTITRVPPAPQPTSDTLVDLQVVNPASVSQFVCYVDGTAHTVTRTGAGIPSDDVDEVIHSALVQGIEIRRVAEAPVVSTATVEHDFSDLVKG